MFVKFIFLILNLFLKIYTQFLFFEEKKFLRLWDGI